MRKMVAVRSSTNPCRTRCNVSIASCSVDLIGTNRIFGRVTTSQIASASLPSGPRHRDKYLTLVLSNYSVDASHTGIVTPAKANNACATFARLC
jgi:hypothetical protein